MSSADEHSHVMCRVCILYLIWKHRCVHTDESLHEGRVNASYLMVAETRTGKEAVFDHPLDSTHFCGAKIKSAGDLTGSGLTDEYNAYA